MIKTTRLASAYRDEHLSFDTFLSVLSFKHPFALFYWWSYICCKLTKQLISSCRGAKQDVFSSRKIEKANDFCFQLFVHSFRDFYISELFLLVVMFIIYTVFALLMLSKKNDMYSKYNEILDITDTTELTEAYSDLENIGDDWWYYFKGLIFMNLVFINFICQDISVMISLMARKITGKALSRIYMYKILLDLIAAVLAVYTFVKYMDDYNVDMDEFRSEEQNYRRMRASETDGYNTNGVFTFMIFFLMLRLFMQMVYDSSYGTLIQIIFRMIEDCIRFLVIFAFMLTCFATGGCLLFSELQAYSDLSESLKTLYESALGGFDYGMFDDMERINPTYGKAYLTIYLLISMILLLNFLIAILSDTYAKYIGVGTALMNAEIIKLRLINEHHPHYLCLVKGGHLLFGWFTLLTSPFILI